MVVTTYFAARDNGPAGDPAWEKKSLETRETNNSKRRKDAKTRRQAMRLLELTARIANQTQEDFSVVANRVLPLGLRQRLHDVQERYK